MGLLEGDPANAQMAMEAYSYISYYLEDWVNTSLTPNTVSYTHLFSGNGRVWPGQY